MNGIIEKEIKIENMIYEIRGRQVMLDSDLAKLYQCANGTKTINLAVKRNIERFPNDFYFQLTKDEISIIISRFQTETLNNELKRGSNIKYLPYVFTEQGVAMLSSVLRTEIASRVSVEIMRAFVALRKYISEDLLEQRYMRNMLIRHDGEIKLLQESFDKLQNKELVNEIYFNGQIYDAYSKILEIMSKANKEIVIIDNYADKTLLDMISRMKVKVLLITKNNNLLFKLDIEKYNKQYNNLIVKYDNNFHDRYIILDSNIIYHCGASINHIGSKTFSINILQEKEIIKLLIDKIISII